MEKELPEQYKNMITIALEANDLLEKKEYFLDIGKRIYNFGLLVGSNEGMGKAMDGYTELIRKHHEQMEAIHARS